MILLAAAFGAPSPDDFAPEQIMEEQNDAALLVTSVRSGSKQVQELRSELESEAHTPVTTLVERSRRRSQREQKGTQGNKWKTNSAAIGVKAKVNCSDLDIMQCNAEPSCRVFGYGSAPKTCEYNCAFLKKETQCEAKSSCQWYHIAGNQFAPHCGPQNMGNSAAYPKGTKGNTRKQKGTEGNTRKQKENKFCCHRR